MVRSCLIRVTNEATAFTKAAPRTPQSTPRMAKAYISPLKSKSPKSWVWKLVRSNSFSEPKTREARKTAAPHTDVNIAFQRWWME